MRRDDTGTRMIDRPLRDVERSRLETLERFAVLDTPPEEVFDRLIQLAAKLFDTPIALLSFIDAHRQWFKASVGLSVAETRREVAFCDVAIQGDGVMVVPDALTDERFKSNPLVLGNPNVRFYAGAPLVAADGSKLGTLCVIDHRPRTFEPEQIELLAELSRLAIEHLELRLELLEATAAKNELRAVINASPSPIVTVKRSGEVTSWNGAAVRAFGWAENEIVGRIAPYVPAYLMGESDELRRKVIEDGMTLQDHATRRVRKDGSWMDVSLSGGAILDRQGLPTGAVFVMDDVTDARRAQQIERHRYEVLEMAANDAPLDRILDRLIASVEYSLPGARGTVMILEGDRLYCAAANAAIPPAYMAEIEGIAIGPTIGSCGAAAFYAESIVVADIATHPFWSDYRELVTLSGQAACWSAPIKNGRGRVLGTLAFYFQDIREPRDGDLRFIHEAAHVASIAIESANARAELQELALRDSLTHLPNRTLFEDRLRQAVAAAKRSGQRFALGLLDLDRFKLVNDNLGHAVGDQLLREVASRLQRSVRPQDTIARMGGDEFLLLVTDVEDRPAARQVAERFLASLDRSFSPGGHEVFVRASMGISVYPDDAVEPTQLLRLADRAMYRAKAGGESIAFYDETEQRDGFANLTLETNLNRALEQHEFVLAYQPQVSVATGDVLACEALLRWHHPELGTMLPERFIAIAEETGLVISIGAWVLGEACRFARRWHDAGGPGMVAVNVSPRQFEDRQFVQTVVDAVNDAGIAPRQLRLEITESLIMRSPEAAAATLQELRDFGVCSVIDDFGIGYSSLNYLKRFPIDGLKIDRVFLREIVGDDATSNDEAIIRAILAVGRALDLRVVAEGVETPAQLAFLRANGCDVAQGYLFAYPLSADDMVRWPPG